MVLHELKVDVPKGQSTYIGSLFADWRAQMSSVVWDRTSYFSCCLLHADYAWKVLRRGVGRGEWTLFRCAHLTSLAAFEEVHAMYKMLQNMEHVRDKLNKELNIAPHRS